MPMIVRKGDAGSHGGAVTTGAAKWKCMDAPIARKGDIYACPLHGPNPIIQGSSKWKCEGAEIARHGDLTNCGASLISGQSKWNCD